MNLGDAPVAGPSAEDAAVQPATAPGVIVNPFTNVLSSILGRRRLSEGEPAGRPLNGVGFWGTGENPVSCGPPHGSVQRWCLA